MKAFWFCIVLMFVLAGAVVASRYTVQVDPAIYVQPVDAEDGLYKFFARDPNGVLELPDDWIARFGDNERTLLVYNLSVARVQLAQQAQQIAAIAEDVKKLKLVESEPPLEPPQVEVKDE